MKFRMLQLFGLIALAAAGCRAPASTAEQEPPTLRPSPPPPVAAAPPPVVEGSYSLPPFAGGTSSRGVSVEDEAAAVRQASASAPCADSPPSQPKRGWRSWLPTKDHSNDPRRERGQFADGWYEPEYRGISD